jgi:23S rRNA G2445 N2-methylase RlmL
LGKAGCRHENENHRIACSAVSFDGKEDMTESLHSSRMEEDGTGMESKAYRRRLKRYVQGAIHRFAAIVPEELRVLCKKELQDLGFSDLELSEAGVEFAGNLSACYLANLRLRTASRILCRVHFFRAGAIEEFFSHVSAFPWELWISRTVPVKTEAYIGHSRIRHETLVRETLFEGIQKRFGGLQLSGPREMKSALRDTREDSPVTGMSQRVMAHIRENRCQLSLDTSGANLHERGYRLKHGGAPLRETLAAGVLLKCGWSGATPLIDGMTGSGTIAIEGALISGRHAPGINRNFLFQRWPAFREESWNYLRRKAGEQARAAACLPVMGIDRSTECLEMAEENAERAGVGGGIRWIGKDFLEFDPSEENLVPGLVVLNPPYGRRLGHRDRTLYEGVGRHLRGHFEGWQVAVIAPDESLALAMRIPGARLWRIRHGGLRVMVVLGRL